MNEIYYEDELSDVSQKETPEQEEEPEVSLKKPYLEVDDLENGTPKKEIILLEWLNFLFSKTNLQNLIEVLLCRPWLDQRRGPLQANLILPRVPRRIASKYIYQSTNG